MGSQPQTNIMSTDEAEDAGSFLLAMSTVTPMALTMVLKTACELQLFDLIANAASSSSGGLDQYVSAAEIASLLPTRNPQAPAILDRMLRLLASASYLNCKVVTIPIPPPNNNSIIRLYSLTARSELLIRDKDGVSHADLALLFWDKVLMDSWGCLKDTILDGGVPFDRAHGMNAFEYSAKDSRFNDLFNKAMFSHTCIITKRVVEIYKGFEGVKELVDVGGGLGATVKAIVSNYPNIQAINFDLPHVIKNTTPQKGVEHIAGDMFESVPKAEMIIMKCILHDWTDDQCLTILKNCLKALPESGKVVVVETILAENPDGDLLSSVGFAFDVGMMIASPGGKERTMKEWEVLAKRAGFASIKPICRAHSDWVIEFYPQ